MEALHSWHRHAQQERLAGHTADTIILKKGEYLKLTASDKHEINFHGRMFDIVIATERGNLMLLAGHFDGFDDKIFKVVHALQGDGGQEQEAPHLRLFVYNGILPAAFALPCEEQLRMPVSHIVSGSPALLSPLQDVLKGPPEKGI